MANRILFPGWRWGPNGECAEFQRAEDVPEGWTRDHPANWPDGVFPGKAKKAGPLDHDGDGQPGGSKPGPQSTAAKGAARRRAKVDK